MKKTEIFVIAAIIIFFIVILFLYIRSQNAINIIDNPTFVGEVVGNKTVTRHTSPKTGMPITSHSKL